MLKLYHTAHDIETLGPGRRFCIWTQGCMRRCPGCMSPDTQSFDGGYLQDESELCAEMLRYDFDGITISGGEPVLQSSGLVKLISMLRKERETGVILYTGYTIEELKSMEDISVAELIGSVDLIIDGIYIREYDDSGSWRGSANQRAICVSDRYKEAVKEHFGKVGERKQQFYLDERGPILVGLKNNQ